MNTETTPDRRAPADHATSDVPTTSTGRFPGGSSTHGATRLTAGGAIEALAFAAGPTVAEEANPTGRVPRSVAVVAEVADDRPTLGERRDAGAFGE